MREFAQDPKARSPADGHRALRYLERRKAGCRPLSTPLPDPRGAPGAAPRARGRAGTNPDRARPGRAPARAPFGIAVRPHLRLTRERAPGSRVRGAPGRGTPRAGGRPGRGACRGARSTAEDGRLGRRATQRSRASLRVAGLPSAGRAAWSVDGVPVPRPRRLREEGVEVLPDGTLRAAAEARAARRSRHETASRGRTGGGSRPRGTCGQRGTGARERSARRRPRTAVLREVRARRAVFERRLDDRERATCGREEEVRAASSDPERPQPPRARKSVAESRSSSHAAAMAPRS